MPWTKLNLKIIQVSLALWLSLLWSHLSLAALAMAYVPPREEHWENIYQQLGKYESYTISRTTNPYTRCLPSAILVVLIPKNGLGLTTESFPKFFFYLVVKDPDYYGSDELSIEFTLTDNSNNQTEEIYKATFKTSLEKHYVGYISLPSEAGLLPLEVDRIYNWQFRILVSTYGHSRTARGQIVRVQLPLETTTQLEQKTPLEQARIYASLGVWYDALAILARLRLEEPDNQNIRREWEELLESVELDTLETEIATAPLMSEESAPTEISNKCL